MMTAALHYGNTGHHSAKATHKFMMAVLDGCITSPSSLQPLNCSEDSGCYEGKVQTCDRVLAVKAECIHIAQAGT